MKARLDRQHADLAAGEQRLERVDVEAVVVGGHSDQVHAELAHRPDHRGEARVLAGDDVAAAEDRAAGERQALAGAVGDHDVVGVLGGATLGREPRELVGKLGQALDVGVLERHLGLLAHRRRDRLSELGRREQPGRGVADRERHQPLAGRLAVHLGEHPVAVGLVGGRQRVALPGDRVHRAGAGGAAAPRTKVPRPTWELTRPSSRRRR